MLLFVVPYLELGVPHLVPYLGPAEIPSAAVGYQGPTPFLGLLHLFSSRFNPLPLSTHLNLPQALSGKKVWKVWDPLTKRSRGHC